MCGTPVSVEERSLEREAVGPWESITERGIPKRDGLITPRSYDWKQGVLVAWFSSRLLD